MRFVVHCRAGFRIGMGHVVRTGALLHELPADLEVVACVDETLARPYFPPNVRYRPPTLEAVDEELAGPAGTESVSSFLFLDLPDYGEVPSLRGSPQTVFVAIDEFGGPGVAADIVVNPSDHRESCRYPDLPSHGLVLRGLPYVMLRRDFLAGARPSQDGDFGFVIGSGSKSARWAHDIIDNLDTSGVRDVPMIVSTAFPDFAGARVKAEARRISLLTGLDAPGMRQFYGRLQLCVMTGGTAIFEAMACATPLLCHPILDPMVDETRELSERGALVELPRENARASHLRPLISKLLADRSRLRRVSDTAGHLVDGRGAARLAAVIGDVASACQTGATKAEAVARQRGRQCQS